LDKLTARFQKDPSCKLHRYSKLLFVTPNNSVTASSMMYSTVPSPFSHILVDYRNLRRALLRRSYADAWNTQAKLVCSYTSQKNMYSVNEGNVITASDWNTPQNRTNLLSDSNLPTEVDQNAYVRDALMENMTYSKETDHKPLVYSLPKNSKLENVQKLDSILDTEPMQLRLVKDVASLMGIPFEMISGGYGDRSAEKRALNNGRVFASNMMRVCRHLENLLLEVYTATYGVDEREVIFTVRPTARMEVQTVAELVQLMDAGVVSYDHAMEYSNMLLGFDLDQTLKKPSRDTLFARPFVTPHNRKELASVQAPAAPKPPGPSAVADI
ncbi:MAG: hypothetical protein EB075_15370, partial [Bacteroidetes bacterium]|nr:hypothetical protein [Bacteroidota bacterium]